MEGDWQQELYLQQIEELRKKMVATALMYGINHPKVLWYSQQIDEKHNHILKNKYKLESDIYEVKRRSL